MPDKITVEHLKELHKVGTDVELSKILNISVDNIRSWKKRGVPKSFQLDIVQNVPQKIGNSSIVKIPIFEALAGCGASGMTEQLVIGEDSFVFDNRVFPSDITTKNIAMIRIVGDSMAPYLDENDWALIELRNGRNIEPIEAVYLIEYEGSVQIKRVQVIGRKAIIKSDNKEYSPFELKINEFDIVGKIVARLKFGSPMLVRG